MSYDPYFMQAFRLHLANILTENERKMAQIVKAARKSRWTDEQVMQSAASDQAMLRLLSKEAALKAAAGGSR